VLTGIYKMDWQRLVKLTNKHGLTWAEEFGDDITFELYVDKTDEPIGVFDELEDMLQFLEENYR
jgi:hypothetical protein